jgi:hypothetical protein
MAEPSKQKQVFVGDYLHFGLFALILKTANVLGVWKW